jgi:hypothetical protein
MNSSAGTAAAGAVIVASPGMWFFAQEGTRRMTVVRVE